MLVNRTNLLNIDVAPVIRNGRTLVPLRVISDALGYNVVWNDPNRVVSNYNNIRRNKNGVFF